MHLQIGSTSFIGSKLSSLKCLGKPNTLSTAIKCKTFQCTQSWDVFRKTFITLGLNLRPTIISPWGVPSLRCTVYFVGATKPWVYTLCNGILNPSKQTNLIRYIYQSQISCPVIFIYMWLFLNMSIKKGLGSQGLYGIDTRPALKK